MSSWTVFRNLSFVAIYFFSKASANLPSYPLAVRNPFLSAWVPGGHSNDFPHAQVQFWAGQPLCWTILARINSKTYSLSGAPQVLPNCLFASQSSINYTSTHTIVELEAGSVGFTLDFFSPVSPKDYVRQSIPFSYFTVTAQIKDGSSHTIEIMSGIDARWTGEDISEAEFGIQSSGSSAMINMSIPNYTYYTVHSDMTTWGHIVLAAEQSNDSVATQQFGDGPTIYQAFAKKRKLAGQGKGNTAGVSKSFGNITSKASATFAVGLYQEHSINYLGTIQTHYYRLKYPTSLQAMDHFFDDFMAVDDESNSFDQQIAQQSSVISGNYSDITSAVVRQV